MNSNTVKITLQVDDKGTVKVKGMGTALENMGTKGKTAGKSLGELTLETASLTGGFEKMKAASVRTENSFAGLGIDARKLGSDLGLTDKAFVSLQSRMIKTQAAKAQEDALLDIARAADLTEDEIKDLGAQFKLSDTQIGNVNTRLGKSSGTMGGVTTSAGLMGTAIKGAMAYFSVSALIEWGSAATQAMDKFTAMENKLKLSTSTHRELNEVLESTYSIAAKTRNGWEGTADLYARLERSTRDLNYSQTDLLGVTESINKAVAISGTTAQAAEAALFQLGQGLGSGALRGEELNSILEQTPRLAKAIADGLGVSISQLREMGAAGELNAQKVVDALQSQASVLADEFSKTTGTMEDGWTRVGDASIRFFGVLDDNVGVTDAVGSSLNIMAEAIDNATRAMDEGKPTTKAYIEYLKTFATYAGTGGALMRGMQDGLMAWLATREKLEQEAEEQRYRYKVDWNARHEKADEELWRNQSEVIAESRKVFEKNLARKGELLTTWEKTQLKSLKKEEKAESTYVKDSYTIYKKGLQRRGDLLTDWEKDQIEAQEDLVDEFEELTGDQYEFERETIREKARMYEEAGADKVEVAEWAKDEIERINQEEKDDYEEKLRDEIEASDNFFAGVKEGFKSLTERQQTWGETGIEIMELVACDGRDALSSNLFDALHGDFDSLGDAWADLWDSMLLKLTDTVADMVVTAASNEVMDLGSALVGSLGLGGMGDAAMDMLGDVGDWALDLLTFHSGAYELKPDEFTGKLQQGEMIIPKDQADQIRASMDAHGYGGDFFQSLADTVNASVAPGYGFQSLTGLALQNSVVDSLAMAGLAGANSALGTYSLATQYGLSSSAATDYAIKAFAAQSIPSFAGGLISSALTQGFGLDASSLDLGFGSVGITSIVDTALQAAIATGLLGGIPGTFALAASPLIGLGLDFALDAMGVRVNEEVREQLEDAYGEIGGRQVNSAIVGMGLTPEMVDAYNDVWAVDPRTNTSIKLLSKYITPLAQSRETRAYAMQWSTHGESPGTGPTTVNGITGPGNIDGGSGGDGIGGSGGSMGGGIGAGNSPGSGAEDGHRWTGGPTYAGHLYEINEYGREMFMPGQDGRILNAKETSEMLATLKQIASGGSAQNITASLVRALSVAAGQNQNITINIDGREIGSVVADQMTHNSDLIEAVRRVC